MNANIVKLTKNQVKFLKLIRDENITLGSWLPSNAPPKDVKQFAISNGKGNRVVIAVSQLERIRDHYKVSNNIDVRMFDLTSTGKKVLNLHLSNQ